MEVCGFSSLYHPQQQLTQPLRGPGHVCMRAWHWQQASREAISSSLSRFLRMSQWPMWDPSSQPLLHPSPISVLFPHVAHSCPLPGPAGMEDAEVNEMGPMMWRHLGGRQAVTMGAGGSGRHARVRSQGMARFGEGCASSGPESTVSPHPPRPFLGLRGPGTWCLSLCLLPWDLSLEGEKERERERERERENKVIS